jgi:hypothetical protein
MEKKFYKSVTGKRFIIELENSHYFISIDTNDILFSNKAFVDTFNIFTECSKEEVENVLDLIYNNLKQLF